MIKKFCMKFHLLLHSIRLLKKENGLCMVSSILFPEIISPHTLLEVQSFTMITGKWKTFRSTHKTNKLLLLFIDKQWIWFTTSWCWRYSKHIPQGKETWDYSYFSLSPNSEATVLFKKGRGKGGEQAAGREVSQVAEVEQDFPSECFSFLKEKFLETLGTQAWKGPARSPSPAPDHGRQTHLIIPFIFGSS